MFLDSETENRSKAEEQERQGAEAERSVTHSNNSVWSSTCCPKKSQATNTKKSIVMI